MGSDRKDDERCYMLRSGIWVDIGEKPWTRKESKAPPQKKTKTITLTLQIRYIPSDPNKRKSSLHSKRRTQVAWCYLSWLSKWREWSLECESVSTHFNKCCQGPLKPPRRLCCRWSSRLDYCYHLLSDAFWILMSCRRCGLRQWQGPVVSTASNSCSCLTGTCRCTAGPEQSRKLLGCI